MKVIDYRTTKFVMVPRSLVEDKTLIARDKAVYMSLCLFTNNDTKQAYPSIDTISQLVGCSRSSTVRALRALEDGGYIKREKRTNGRGGQTTNIYYLLDK